MTTRHNDDRLEVTKVVTLVDCHLVRELDNGIEIEFSCVVDQSIHQRIDEILKETDFASYERGAVHELLEELSIAAILRSKIKRN